MEIEERGFTRAQTDELLRALSTLAEAAREQQRVILKLRANPKAAGLNELIHAAGDRVSVAVAAVTRLERALNR